MVASSSVTGKESLASALGRLSSGVYIVTLYADDGEKQGMLATWIAQAAFDPPMLSLSVQKGREILNNLNPTRKFSLNILSKKNMEIFKAFAKPHSDGLDRFHGLPLVSDKASSGPVFAESLAYLDCVARVQVEAGDHLLILSEVEAGALLNESDEAFLHTRKNGFQY